MHEIITIQLGQRANYLATHFWNLQESYFTYNEDEPSIIDHDVHFRPGIGVDRIETFTPRTVIYDLKGAFGTLRKHNALYDLTEGENHIRGLWDGKEVVQKQAPIPQCEYQQSLDQGLSTPVLTTERVRYWSDFNRVFYHPRSIIQLNEYELNSRTMPFEDWMAGEELFKDLDKEHGLLDRDLRPFAEECDQIRALQLFSGVDDAWGGFSASYVDNLRDEFGKTSIWIWAIESGEKLQRNKQSKRAVNLAKSVSEMAPFSSLYVPIVDPPRKIPSFLTVDRQSEWHTSALICSAVETATLPTRLRQRYDFEASLVGDDGVRKIFELQSSIFRDNGSDARQLDVLGSPSKPLPRFDLSLSYDNATISGKNFHVFNQVEVARGIIPDNSGQKIIEDTGIVRKQRFYNSEPMLQRFDIALQFPLLGSAPRDMFPVAPADHRINMLAVLSATSRTGDYLRGLQVTTRSIIETEERETIYNCLGELRESYEAGWTSDSESEDD